jgi:hypothetical protein
MSSMSGMESSIKIKSGLSFLVSSTASHPLAASSTTRIPGWAFISLINPRRMIAW